MLKSYSGEEQGKCTSCRWADLRERKGLGEACTITSLKTTRRVGQPSSGRSD